MEDIADLENKGFCILRAHLSASLIRTCREVFWPILLTYLHHHQESANRGPCRHFLAVPFDPPCFAPEFFFDARIMQIVQAAMGDRVVADQWGCDVPLMGSQYQGIHADYQRPLFAEYPDLPLPPYMLSVSFGLTQITAAHGPIEIAPGTHRMARKEARRAVETGAVVLQEVVLDIGDVLIRHPWALHRGTPNMTSTPRALLTIRYVRRWYSDNSRDVTTIPRQVWESLSPTQKEKMRFPIAD